MRLILNDSLPITGAKSMQVSELREALADFNQAAIVAAAVPTAGRHEVRPIHVVGHLHHPGEVKDDHTVHTLDIVCDSWDAPSGPGPVATVADLVEMIAPFPDPMHVRVAVPVVHDSMSHRMLDIVMLGRAVASGGGVQLVTESWDNPYQIIKTIQPE